MNQRTGRSRGTIPQTVAECLATQDEKDTTSNKSHLYLVHEAATSKPVACALHIFLTVNIDL